MCPVPTKRLVLLAASALLLGTLIVSLRGISYTPANQQLTEDPLSKADPLEISGSRDTISLRVVVSLSDEAYRTLQALNRMFLRENTDMTVRLSNMEADALDEYLQRAFRLGEVSDIIMLDNELVKQYAAHARLQPTDDYYTSVTESEFLPIITEQLKWNGYLWGIPFQIEPYILAYNEAVWTELTGDTTPRDAQWLWTMYQYNGLYVDDQDPMAYAALAYMLDRNWQFPVLDEGEEAEEASGGPAIAEGIAEEEAERSNTPSDDPAKHDASEQEEAVAAMAETWPQARLLTTRARDMVRASASDAAPSEASSLDALDALTGAISGEAETEPGDRTISLAERFAADSVDDPWERLRRGELAAIIAPLHEYESRRSALIAAVLLPMTDGNDGALLTGKSFVLSAETTDQEAAFRWIKAILDSYHDKVSASVAGGYPADAEVYKLFINNPTYGLLRSAVEKGYTLMPDPYIEQKLSLLRERLPQLVHEDVSPLEAMLEIYVMFEEAGWLS